MCCRPWSFHRLQAFSVTQQAARTSPRAGLHGFRRNSWTAWSPLWQNTTSTASLSLRPGSPKELVTMNLCRSSCSGSPRRFLPIFDITSSPFSRLKLPIYEVRSLHPAYSIDRENLVTLKVAGPPVNGSVPNWNTTGRHQPPTLAAAPSPSTIGQTASARDKGGSVRDSPSRFCVLTGKFWRLWR